MHILQAGKPYVTQAGLVLVASLLPQLPKYWDYLCVPGLVAESSYPLANETVIP